MALSFDQSGVTRIVAAVRKVERALPGTTFGGGGTSRQRDIWLKLGGEDVANPGRYQWTMQTAAGFTLSDSAIATTDYTAIDANLTPGLTGRIVRARFEGFTTGGLAVYRFGDAPPAPFLVKVTKDGGAQGTATTAATWTYTVAGLDAVELGTELAPQQARANGVTNFAPADSYGLAAYDGGTLLLLTAYGEYRGKVTCPEGV